MAFETATEIVKVRVPDGTELNFEVSRPGRERKVGKLEDVLDSSKIAKTIEGTVEILRGSFERIKPDKASVKFGLKVAVESGQLTAVVLAQSCPVRQLPDQSDRRAHACSLAGSKLTAQIPSSSRPPLTVC